MIRYCVLCGQLMGEDDVCRNPNCRSNHREQERPVEDRPSGRRPVRLADRLKDMDTAKQRERKAPLPEFDEEDWETREDPFFEEDVPDSEPLEDEGNLRSRGTLFVERSRRFVFDVDRELAKYRQLFAVMASILLSAVGTLIFGILHLEDFFWRWVVTGVMIPVMAYGASFFGGWILTASARENTEEDLPKLVSAIASSAKIPNVLLLLSCFFSPLDKNMSIFQFFALLTVVAWVVCLCYELMTSFPRKTSAETPASPAAGLLSKGTPILLILFAFLALTSMRAIWVWYLTGDFRFTLHLPLNVFF